MRSGVAHCSLGYIFAFAVAQGFDPETGLKKTRSLRRSSNAKIGEGQGCCSLVNRGIGKSRLTSALGRAFLRHVYRPRFSTNEHYLVFYYQYKSAMKKILAKEEILADEEMSIPPFSFWSMLLMSADPVA
jgi:hypothetical protein